MNHTYTTQDGKTARLVNPYLKPITDTRMPDVQFNPSWYKFEATVKFYPLTTERPDLIGNEFQGEVVWQFFDAIYNDPYGKIPRGWTDCTDNNPKYAEDFNLETRQAVQALSVPVKGEEKLPYTLHRAGEEKDECVIIEFSVPKHNAEQLRQDFINYILNNSKSF